MENIVNEACGGFEGCAYYDEYKGEGFCLYGGECVRANAKQSLEEFYNKNASNKEVTHD